MPAGLVSLRSVLVDVTVVEEVSYLVETTVEVSRVGVSVIDRATDVHVEAPVFPSLVDVCDNVSVSSVVVLLCVTIETVCTTLGECTYSRSMTSVI